MHVTIPYCNHQGGFATDYVHAWTPHLELVPIANYRIFQGFGSFVRVQPVEATYARLLADVAHTFARTAIHTPYGSYPNKDDFKAAKIVTTERQNASRYDGMLAAIDVQREEVAVLTELPFEFASLARLLKWTARYRQSQAFSERRGITCAAFAAACNQVARLSAYLLENVYDRSRIVSVVEEVAKLMESKVALRNRKELAVAIPKKAARGGKHDVFKAQALRGNSNRELTQSAREKLDDAWRSMEEALPETLRAAIAESALERDWVVIMSEYLKIEPYAMQTLHQILGEFYFDAKYISSPVLARYLMATPGAWTYTIYDKY